MSEPTVVVTQPSPGVVSVASDTISALKTSPILLVVILLNCVFIAAAAYYLRAQQDNAFRLVDKLFDHCLVQKSRAPDQGLLFPPSLLNGPNG